MPTASRAFRTARPLAHPSLQPLAWRCWASPVSWHSAIAEHAPYKEELRETAKCSPLDPPRWEGTRRGGFILAQGALLLRISETVKSGRQKSDIPLHGAGACAKLIAQIATQALTDVGDGTPPTEFVFT